MSILCSPPPRQQRVERRRRKGRRRRSAAGRGLDRAYFWRWVFSASAVVAAAATAAGLDEVGLDLGPLPLGALEATAGPSQGQGTAASFNKEPAEPLGTGGPGRRGGVGMRG